MVDVMACCTLQVDLTFTMLELDVYAGVGLQFEADPPLNYSNYQNLDAAGREALESAARDLQIGTVQGEPNRTLAAPLKLSIVNEKGWAIDIGFQTGPFNNQSRGFSLDYTITPPADSSQRTASVSFTLAVRGKVP